MGLGVPDQGRILIPGLQDEVRDIRIQKTDLGKSKMHKSDLIENELDWSVYSGAHDNRRLVTMHLSKELDTSYNDEEGNDGDEEELDLYSSSSSDSEFDEIRSFGSQSTLSRTPSPVLASEIGLATDSNAAGCFGDYRSPTDVYVCGDNVMTDDEDDRSEGAMCAQNLISQTVGQIDHSNGVVDTKDCVNTAASAACCHALKVQQHDTGSVLPAANKAAIKFAKASEESLLTGATLEESFLGSYVPMETEDLDCSVLSSDSDSEDDNDRHSFSSATTLTGSPPPGWADDFEDEVYENASGSHIRSENDNLILQSPSISSTVNTDQVIWLQKDDPSIDAGSKGDSSEVRAGTNRLESSQYEEIDSEDSLPAPVTASLEGRKLEALISPFVHLDLIFWLGKFQDSSAVEIIPGSLVNTYFFQDVINFYQQKLRFVNGEPKVVLRIQDIDAHAYR